LERSAAQCGAAPGLLKADVALYLPLDPSILSREEFIP
jgi:hypothetical protein